MVIEHYTDNHSEDLSCGDYEGYNVLLKLLDHAVNKDLANRGETGGHHDVLDELWITSGELIRGVHLARGDGVAPAE